MVKLVDFKIGLPQIWLIIDIIINNEVLLLTLVVVGVKWLTSVSLGVCSLIFFLIIVFEAILNVNVLDYLLLSSLGTLDTLVTATSLIKDYKRSIEEVLLLFEYHLFRGLIRLSYDGDVASIVDYAERQVICGGLCLNHRVSEHILMNGLILECARHSEGARVVEFLHLVSVGMT